MSLNFALVGKPLNFTPQSCLVQYRDWVTQDLQKLNERSIMRHQVSITWDDNVIQFILNQMNLINKTNIRCAIKQSIINKIAFAHEDPELIKPGVSLHITVDDGDTHDLDKLKQLMRIKILIKQDLTGKISEI